MALNRRNDFPAKGEAKPPPLPAKQPVHRAGPITRSVPHEVAEIAAHLAENPVWVELIEILKSDAVARMANSPLGQAGETERTAARYEIEALTNLQNRIWAYAAENSPEFGSDA